MSYQAREKTWRKLIDILVSERIHSEKTAYCVIPSGNTKTKKTVRRSD